MTINPITELQGVVARDIRDLILRIFEPPPGILVSDLHADPDVGSVAFTITEQPSGEQMTVRITNTTALNQSALLRMSVGTTQAKGSLRGTTVSPRRELPATRGRGRPRTVQPKRREVLTFGESLQLDSPDCPDCKSNKDVWPVVGGANRWSCFREPPHEPPVVWHGPN